MEPRVAIESGEWRVGSEGLISTKFSGKIKFRNMLKDTVGIWGMFWQVHKVEKEGLPIRVTGNLRRGLRKNESSQRGHNR